MEIFPSLPQGDYRKKGLVLKSQPSGEKGKNLLLFLKEIGPAWVSVPGAASGKNRLSGATEPLVWGYFTLYRSPRRLYVKDVKVEEDFWTLRQNGTKLTAALKLCGHMVRFALPGQAQDELIPLLYWSLKALECGAEPASVEFRFLFRWCSSLGLSPALDRCASCGNPASTALMTPEGLVCGSCLGSRSFQGNGWVLQEKELNRLKKAVMLSGKAFRAEPFDKEESHLFGRASALFLKLLEGSV